MKKIYARLNPLHGPRFAFGQEARGIIKLIENAVVGEDVVFISISSPTQLLATDLWCQHKGYELEVIGEDGKVFESVTAAHKYVNDEYIYLDLGVLDDIFVDINQE